MQCLTKFSRRHLLGSPRRWFHTPIVLRPYQDQCINDCIGALDIGTSRIGVSLPTGSGKTTVFISLLSRIKAPLPHAQRSLIIVNTIELARQSAEQVSRLFPDWTVEIEQGTKHRATGRADVTVATYQTLGQPERLQKFDPSYLKAVIIDEAHHAAAPTYRRLLSHFHEKIKHPVSELQPPAPLHTIPIIGFSATFSRHDGLALSSVFEEIVHHRDFLEMIQENWLCGIRFTAVQAELELEKITLNHKSGDFNSSSLARIINTPSINNLVVRTWMDRAVTRRSTVVFCVDVAHAADLSQAFRSFGVDARYIHSKTPANERKDMLAVFKDGEFPVLVNCAILTEGTDIPSIDCVMLARPTRSRNLFQQMIGRGMRLSPGTGKTDCRIIDFVDSTSRTCGVVSVPTLFGLDPDTLDIENETLASLKEKMQTTSSGCNAPLPSVEPVGVTYTDYDDPSSWIEDNSASAHISKISRHAWVACGDDIYVLECLGKGHLRVEPFEQEDRELAFRAFFAPAASTIMGKLPSITPYLRSRPILVTQALDEAIRAADTYLQSLPIFGGLRTGLLRMARWRQEPATDNQKKWLAKRFLNAPRSFNIEEITKGDAANILTRLKHGAQGRHKQKTKSSAKRSREKERELARAKRERVTVGPLTI